MENSFKRILFFSLKVSVVTVAIVFAFNNMCSNCSFPPKNEITKLFLISFIQNPYVLYQLSEMEKKKGNSEKAKVYIEAALALVEIHGAPKNVLEKYKNMLDDLNNE